MLDKINLALLMIFLLVLGVETAIDLWSQRIVDLVTGLLDLHQPILDTIKRARTRFNRLGRNQLGGLNIYQLNDL